jgi:MFS family permease
MGAKAIHRQAGTAQSDRPRSVLLLAVLCGAQFLDAVNMSAVSIALPGIRRGLGFSPDSLQWVVSIYALALAGLLLPAGRVSDLAGRRRIFISGLLILLVSGTGAAMAPNSGALVAARAAQGAGAALTVPSALAIITTTFVTEHTRSRALAAFGAAAAVGFTVGLVYGGVIDGLIGWRYVFGLTVPVVAIFLVASIVVISPDPPACRVLGSADIPGTLCVTSGLILLSYALTTAGSTGWTTVRTITSLASAVALLAAFVITQGRGRNPLMPLGIWRRRNFAVVMAAAFTAEVPWNGLLYFATLSMQDVLRYSPLETAIAFVPLGLSGYIFSAWAGRLLVRTSIKAVLGSGLALLSAGAAMFSCVGAHTRYWPLILVALVTASAGLAVTFISANVAVADCADLPEQGLIGGLYNTALQVGSGVGLAVLAVIAAASARQPVSGSGLLAGYRVALWTASGLGLLGLAVVLIGFRRPSSAAADLGLRFPLECGHRLLCGRVLPYPSSARS